MPQNYQVQVPGEDPLTEIRATFDGVAFRLQFSWNERFENWTMGILDDNGTELLSGYPIVIDQVLFQSIRSESLPAGYFACIDTQTTGLPPGRDDFGYNRRVQIWYRSDAV